MNLDSQHPMNALIIVAASLVLLSLLLPEVILYMANRSLKKLDGYQGKIRSIRMNLIRGKFTLRDFRVAKTHPATGIETWVLRCPEIVLDLRVSSLVRKVIDGKILVKAPELVYAQILKTEKPTVKEDKKDKPIAPPQPSALKVGLEKMPEFSLAIIITQGKIRYIDHTSTPRIDVGVQNLNVDVTDFSNKISSQTIPAKINMNARLYEGSFTLAMQLKPLEDQLTFDLNTELRDANMVLLNDFFRAYARIDVNKGSFGMETEVVAKEGSFTGYVKPFLKDIDIVGAEDRNDSLFQKIWERMVATVVQGLENNKIDQIATKIQINGRLDNPHINIFSAIGGILRNAFIHALQPSLENALSLRSVVKSAVSGTANFIKKVLL